MNTHTPFVVFAIGHGGGHDFEKALLYRHDIDYKAGTGSYEGEAERVYLAPYGPGYNETMYRRVLKLADEYGQAAVLAVDSNRHAVIIDPSTGEVVGSVGMWREVAPGTTVGDHSVFDGRVFVAS